MKAKFTFEKETKNTIRFQEVVEDGDKPVIGPLYVQKSALENMKYENGQVIEVEITVL